MKKIKIITLTILFMGCVSVYAQQASKVAQHDETGPAIEQTDPAVTPAGQTQVNPPGEFILPAEQDETRPPEGQQFGILPAGETLNATESPAHEITGPDEATGPLDLKPDDK